MSMEVFAGIVNIEIYCEKCKRLLMQRGQPLLNNTIKIKVKNIGKITGNCACSLIEKED